MHMTIQRKVLAELFPVRSVRGGFDRRTHAGKRVFAHASAILEQLGHEPSAAEQAMIIACAHQRLSLETLERKAFDSGEPLPAEYREMADLLTRQLAQLGILRSFGACRPQFATLPRASGDQVGGVAR
jgi:hypothetical protein